MTLSSGRPSPKPQKAQCVADKSSRHLRLRWTRKLPGLTRRLTQSEKASLAWRIIAGGSRPGEARGLLRGWSGWEQLARLMWPVREIPAAPYGLLCFRIRPYRGEPIVLPDKTTVAPGAIVCELHCNNRTILDFVRRRGNPFAAFREDLRTLSKWIQQDALACEIKALYGCTILSRAAGRLGFTVRPRPVTLRQLLEKFFFQGLLVLYNQEGLGRIQHGKTSGAYPAEVWLSRRELIHLYHDHHKPGRRATVKPSVRKQN
jgi:peptidoglycan-N-acetylglucosamine deacetylase